MGTLTGRYPAFLGSNREDVRRLPESWPSEVAAFDRLLAASKLTMLALVGDALHDEGAPCPPLNALTESTVGAIYAVIHDELDFEIEYARENSVRRRTSRICCGLSC